MTAPDPTDALTATQDRSLSPTLLFPADPAPGRVLRRGILLDNAAHLLLVRDAVFFEEIEGVGLGWGFGVWFVEEGLDTEEDFLDGDCRFPAFFFVEDGEADCAGGVDVGVEEWGHEFAFRWLGRVLVWEREFQLKQAAFPLCLLLAGDTAIPLLEVHHAIRAAHGFCEEAKGVVASPLFSLFREPVHAQSHGVVVRLFCASAVVTGSLL